MPSNEDFKPHGLSLVIVSSLISGNELLGNEPG